MILIPTNYRKSGASIPFMAASCFAAISMAVAVIGFFTTIEPKNASCLMVNLMTFSMTAKREAFLLFLQFRNVLLLSTHLWQMDAT